MLKLLNRLRQDHRGVAAVEFAMASTTMMVILMGGFDLGHTLYMQSVMQGTVQRAARNLTLSTGTETERQVQIDNHVRSSIRLLDANIQPGDIAIKRSFYGTFTDAQAARPEDANQDGICSPGEVWIDRNFNDTYDSDGGGRGQGGARDIVVYSVTVDYQRLFPVASLIGMSERVKLNATTVLANQPYGDQQRRTGTLMSRNCP